jgi:hypothetical protein
MNKEENMVATAVAARPVQQLWGLKHKKVETYKGLYIVKCTDYFMVNAFMATPRNFWAVRLRDGTWLYSEGDDPENILMFGQPRYARHAIDQYVGGQRKFEEA